MDDIIRIILALLVGGLIGIEREFRDKAAGFRTLIFICVGATLFTILSINMAGGGEPTRIAANIVVGVGFLGAGVIMREDGGRVSGLTTAATIWLVAALGTGIGAGAYLLSITVALVTFCVLWIFPRLELLIDRVHAERAYRIVSPCEHARLDEIQEAFHLSGLSVRRHRQEKCNDQMISYWFASGPDQAHDRLAERLIADPSVIEFKT
jgi:putative Mg2+ transporter-C (MgtC) family protein